MFANKKSNKLDKWLPKRRYIKVWNRRKSCPLTFNERLVFSLLVYSSRRKTKTGMSQRAIARQLQLDKDTVPKVLITIIGYGLARREAGLVYANEPTGDQINWFVYLNRPGCERWQDQYAYLLVALPAPLQKRQDRKRLRLSPYHVGIYCLLVNREKEGLVEISKASIAGLLGVDVRTVRSGLAALEECGLVELHPRKKTILVFRPSEDQLQWFQPRKEQSKKVPLYSPDDEKPWEGMSDQEIDQWISDPKLNDYARSLRRIRFCGKYSTPEMNLIIKKADVLRFRTGRSDVLGRLYYEAEKEHKLTQSQGKLMGVNSYHLLNYKLDKFLDKKGGHGEMTGPQAC